MKTLNKTTKQAKHFIDEFNYSAKYTDLWKCYKKPSATKWRAENYCRQRCKVENGFDFRFIGFNTSYFTVGYKIKENEKTFLIVITACEYYKIEL